MQSKNLVLILMAGAAVVWAWSSHSAQRPEAASETQAFALPDFRTVINQVSQLEIEKGDDRLIAQRLDGDWIAPDFSGFPLKEEAVRPFLLQLATLDSPLAKTSNPANHVKLEIADSGLDGAGTTVRVRNEAGDLLLDLVMGKVRWQPSPGIYFRQAGQDQVWSAKGTVQLQTDAKSWMERELARIPATEFQAVSLVGEDSFHLRRETATDPWVLEEIPPQGRVLRESNPFAGLAGALGFVNFDGVRPLTEDLFTTEPARTLTWTTFDGGTVTATLWMEEELAWSRLAAGGSLAEEANPLWADWAWQLPSFKADVFQQTWEDWLEPLPSEEEIPTEG